MDFYELITNFKKRKFNDSELKCLCEHLCPEFFTDGNFIFTIDVYYKPHGNEIEIKVCFSEGGVSDVEVTVPLNGEKQTFLCDREAWGEGYVYSVDRMSDDHRKNRHQGDIVARIFHKFIAKALGDMCVDEQHPKVEEDYNTICSNEFRGQHLTDHILFKIGSFCDKKANGN